MPNVTVTSHVVEFVTVSTTPGVETFTLPALPTNGDKITVKAVNVRYDRSIMIYPGDEAHKIDGQDKVWLREPCGCVTVLFNDGAWHCV